MNVYEIGQSYIKSDIEATENFKSELEQYLLYKGKQYAQLIYHRELLDDELFFKVEFKEGSLKSKLKIFGKIAVSGLLLYGGLREAADYLNNDSRSITESIVNDVSKDNLIDISNIIRVERRLGVPGKIQRLYKNLDKIKHEKNDLSPNEQQELIEKIYDQLDEIIVELDDPLIDIIKKDLPPEIPPFKRFPHLPNQDNLQIRNYAIKEEDIGLISEKAIKPYRGLPPIE